MKKNKTQASEKKFPPKNKVHKGGSQKTAHSCIRGNDLTPEKSHGGGQSKKLQDKRNKGGENSFGEECER